MNIISESEHLLIVDNFLPEEKFLNLIKFIQTESFKYIQIGHFNKVYRLSDGNPLEGRVVLSLTGKDINEIPDVFNYPSKTPIDHLIENILYFKEKEKVVGVKDSDWKYFSSKPVVYPPNSGVSWHTDHLDVTGAYTFYCHPYWDVHWAGEILVSNVHVSSMSKVKSRNSLDIYKKSLFDDTVVNHVLQESDGFGTYIIPKPNRIVFLKAGYFHKVQKVGVEAGDRNRSTIVGFFVRD